LIFVTRYVFYSVCIFVWWGEEEEGRENVHDDVELSAWNFMSRKQLILIIFIITFHLVTDIIFI